MKKKLLTGALLAVATLSLASCAEETPTTTTSVPSAEATTTPSTPSTTPSVETPSEAPSTPSVTPTTTPQTVPTNLTAQTLFVVGDSTVSDFNDATYYYPRKGYGTQLSNYLDSKITVKNLALSGRSSKSFLIEANYNTLKSSIKAGDYLVIGFGHNDEKSDDAERFTDASKPTTDPTSFNYSLYENYIKVAQDAGAFPILCTPIVRANSSNDYEGSSGHVVTLNGSKVSYAQSIIDLGQEKNVPVVDLTKATKDIYTEVGYTTAIKYHAWTSSNQNSVDQTHVNEYGAKMVAYNFAELLKNTDSTLKHYVKADITAPTEATDLKVNPAYVEKDYEPFNTEAYQPAAVFTCLTEGWYGTAFGDTGGAPSATFFAREKEDGSFEVGDTAGKGKIAGTSEGLAFAFQKVSKTKNFTLKATMTLTEGDAKTSTGKATKQTGFGLMLRDDCYEPVKDASILSNSVCAGFYAGASDTMVVYSRENTKLTASAGTISGFIANGATAELEIVRLGQVVTCKVVYNGQTYTKTYTDFDFAANDNEFMYIGMYGTRGTTTTYTNVEFTITGDAIAA